MSVRYICLVASVVVPVLCRGLTLPERLPVSVLPENVFLGLGNDDFRESDGRTMAAVVRMLGEESTYNVITLTLRCTNDLSSAETQRRVRMVAEQAHGYGMKVMMDTDPRIARHEFLRRWPADAQRYLEIAFTNAIPCPSFADHMSGGTVPYYETARRIAATRRMPDGRTAFAHEITLYSADVFSPRLLAYSRELMARYKALGVDGAMKDEWGFPPTHGDGFREHRAIWYSDHLAARYRERTGRDLLDDAFLMACGAPGRERERAAAVDAYMQLTLDRNAEIEGDFYAANKELFGPDTYVTKHSTWYPRICPEEFMHNGLDWWRTRRDWAQSDEFTPIPAVCGMAKKCGGANWMNEGYQKEAGLYAEAVWRYALAGGRMVYHPVCPSPQEWAALPYPERRRKSHGDVLKANGRRAQECVRLVNRISSAPIDSPVAFVFSRRRTVNWTDPAYGDWGEERVYGLWRKGWATDLYPADDFAEGTFAVDGEGYLRVGRQRYLALVLHGLDASDRADFARLVGSAALKTRVFESGDSGLERYLEESGAVRQPPLVDCGTRFAHARTWYPNPDGLLRLTDGTAVRIKAVESTRGDPISGTLRLNGVDIRYEATGLFAARVSKTGELEAFAGAGLRRVVAPGVDLSFPDGRDHVFLKASPIPNPILPGFYSDPSACTANGKYCLAVSSLQYFPAIPLFESVDLVHWKLVGHAIEKPGVVPLGGNPEFAGLFAPTIRFRSGRFYMTVGNHACFADGKPQGPVILYADRFEGPWSVPRKIEGLDRPYGDPSIDFVDGKCYFSGTTGFEVHVAEMDADAGRLLEKPRAVWSGTGGTYPEGQHVFRRGEWIYLMMAEGGTEYGHTHVIARSKSVYGPFAGCPRNPIAGHARLAHQGHPLQAVGHGDFVYDRNGNGHFICHAIRPQFGRHHTLGRETVIAPITWESDGWPLVNGGKGVEYVENTENLPVRDWVYIRNPTLENYRIDEGRGVVALVPSPVKLTDADSPTFVGTRQVKFEQTFSGTLLEPPGRDVEAGLADYMGRTHHYAIAVENRGGTCVAFVRYQLGIMSFASEAVAIERFPVELKIVSRQKEIAFYANGRQLGKGDPRHISSETDSDSPYGGLICGFYAVGNASSGEVRFRYDGQEENGR